MRRAAFVSLIALTGLVFLQTPAAAGGWWNFIHLDGPLGIGESLTHRVEDLTFHTMREGKPARGTRWHAYLLPQIDIRALDRAMQVAQPGDWWEPPGTMILAGEVRLSKETDGFVDALVHLTVPEIAPGSYYLMLCDVGCRTPLGEVIPQRVEVVADAFSAQIARKLERTNDRMTGALEDVRNELRRARIKVDALESILIQYREANEVLKDRITALERKRPPTPSPWTAFAGWFVAGVAVSALALTVVHRRRDAVIGSTIPVDVPDDARELIESR